MERQEHLGSFRQKQIVPPANTPHIVNGDRLFNPLGFDRYLRFNGDIGPDRLPSGLGDQDLTADGVGLDAGREVHMRAYEAILGAFVRANIPHHHFTRVHANTHFHFRQTFRLDSAHSPSPWLIAWPPHKRLPVAHGHSSIKGHRR